MEVAGRKNSYRRDILRKRVNGASLSARHRRSISHGERKDSLLIESSNNSINRASSRSSFRTLCEFIDTLIREIGKRVLFKFCNSRPRNVVLYNCINIIQLLDDTTCRVSNRLITAENSRIRKEYQSIILRRSAPVLVPSRPPPPRKCSLLAFQSIDPSARKYARQFSRQILQFISSECSKRILSTCGSQ